jgi:hypothetical protein
VLHEEVVARAPAAGGCWRKTSGAAKTVIDPGQLATNAESVS